MSPCEYSFEISRLIKYHAVRQASGSLGKDACVLNYRCFWNIKEQLYGAQILFAPYAPSFISRHLSQSVQIVMDPLNKDVHCTLYRVQCTVQQWVSDLGGVDPDPTFEKEKESESDHQDMPDLDQYTVK